jgi:hypothetical protein
MCLRDKDNIYAATLKARLAYYGICKCLVSRFFTCAYTIMCLTFAIHNAIYIRMLYNYIDQHRAPRVVRIA